MTSTTNKSDAVIYKTTNNLGGAITGTKVVNKVVGNFFSSVDLAEAILGSTIFWGGYIKNDSLTDIGENFTVFIDPNTPHADDEVTIGLDPAGLNGTMQTIATNATAPTGVEFLLAPTYNQGVFMGTLKPGEKYPFWLKRVVNVTHTEQKHNNFFVNIGFDPPAGSIDDGSGSGGGSGGGGGGGGGPPPSDLDIAVDSDWGTSSGTQASIDNIHSFSGLDGLITAGDIAYKSSINDKWKDMTSGIRQGIPVFWSPGNHDHEDNKGWISYFESLFGVSKTYNSATIGNILIVTGDIYTDFSTSSAQYKFIKKALEDAKNNTSIKWKIVVQHEPLYGSKSQHGNNSKWRDAFFPLFTANGVDLSINGHNHHYERTYPLTFNSGSPSKPTIVHQGDDPTYTDPGGTICLTVGTGGHDIQYDFSGSRNSWSAFGEDTYFGFLMLSLSNGGKTLTGKFYKNSGHSLTDTWSITKA